MRSLKLAMGLLAITVTLVLTGCSQALAPKPAQKSEASLPSVSSLLVHHKTGSAVVPAVPVHANPVRLLIPSIGVNAPIEDIGVTSDGNLAVPQQHPWEDVGWYTAGPRPGDRGSAVIDGHLDRPRGLPAVFWRLRDMRVGDAIQLIDASGETLTFHVKEIDYYPPQDAPIQQIFGNYNGSYLNLITCAGDWIPSQHQTNLRLVVYTTLD